MKELEQKGHNTPVKWIGTKRTLSKMMREKRKHHHDSGTKEQNGMSEGKQDLEGARLQQMLEWSCWKTNNEKNKLDMVLWNTS